MLQVPAWNLDLRGEVLGRDALPSLFSAWQDLCGRCVEDNVYYSPKYAQALLKSVDRDKKVGIAVVWDRESLVGLLPFTRAPFRIPYLKPAAKAWCTKYTFSCMPLLDKTRQAQVAEVLLDVLQSVSHGEWVIPTVNTQGTACRLITAALDRKGYPWAFLGKFDRAALDADSTFDQYINNHISTKRRKDLARNRRRLEQLGTVKHEAHHFGDGLDRAINAFLEIEASGWKGKRGTALACDEASKLFALNAFTGEANDSICRADVLTLNDQPIAVSLMALAGQTGFTVKCCYDETYRNCSAGLLLELEVIRSFLSGKWINRLDSATAGAHVIDDLWSGRIEVADLAFTFSTRCPELRLSALHLADLFTRKAKASLKRLRG